MELELNKTHLTGFKTVLDTTVFHEETMEMIVPDACPDILRIIDTEAHVCLGNKEAMDGRAEISGTVKATVLYLPDGEEGIRRIELSIPFICAGDTPELTTECHILANPRVQMAETRSINPRKVLVRVNLAVCISAYAPIEDCICSGLTCTPDAGVQQLQKTYDAYVVSCVQEKNFTFSDDLIISGSKPEAVELLKNRLTFLCNESKVIGNKLIFKGEVKLQLLYRSAENKLCSADYELPFSQIMEINGSGEDAACTVKVIPTGVVCTLASAGDGRSINVSLELVAQAVVREERSVPVLVDTYATSCTLTPELQAYRMERLVAENSKTQTVREIIETGALAHAVSDAYICIGSILQSREGARLNLTADCTVTVIYTTEGEELHAASRQFAVQCPLELPEDCSCSCLCRCPEAVFATPTTGGIEVRFATEFQFIALTGRTISAVSAVREEERSTDAGERKPSIILRMVGAQECLWDIAKHYGATTKDIMQASELSEESAFTGKLVIIPRKH